MSGARYGVTCGRCGRPLVAPGPCGFCFPLGSPQREAVDAAQERSRDLDRRLSSNRPGLPCCDLSGACTGGASCWHDEPDNIPEDY